MPALAVFSDTVIAETLLAPAPSPLTAPLVAKGEAPPEIDALSVSPSAVTAAALVTPTPRNVTTSPRWTMPVLDARRRAA